VTDESLDRVYRLSLDGATLGFFDLPAKEPRGVTIATVNGFATLVTACANEGFQKIIYLDPVTGALLQEKPAPAQSPEEITCDATGQKMLWHVDGQSRVTYRLIIPTRPRCSTLSARRTSRRRRSRSATCRSSGRRRASIGFP
jgi:hypothetical protein